MEWGIEDLFDFREFRDSVWPAHLVPVGEGEIEKEPFETWWLRNNAELANLASGICEQWIYRHWSHTQFNFLPLDSLRFEQIELSTDEILQSVHRELGCSLHPEFDRQVFERPIGGIPLQTARAFIETATWDFPIITLKTPNGFIGHQIASSEIKMVLVEGHQRHRYLNALHHFGDAPEGPHRVFSLSSPVVG
ncbi:MAG: hypothetical protein GC188_06500 [Alphaproteobacteria bacterium]|nr:hypothetical protein [Alphaproteobacteria bacterium]